MKSVLQCLQEARSDLEAALIKLQTGQLPLATDQESASTDSGPAINNDYDPDDLAAAFFAQQAQKKQAESKLPIDAWAKTIHATTTIVRNEARVLESSSRFGGNRSAEDTPMIDQKKIFRSRTKDNELWKVFESAYAES